MSDILILTHIDYCPPGHLAAVLDAAQRDFQVLRVDLGELDGIDLDRPKAVAIMGGPMSVNDPLPWLAAEIAALQHFIRRDIPLIGHCLGGQLLAKALGAEIKRMPYTESGWQPLHQVRAAVPSPWLAHLPAQFSMFQWHGDTFALPAGAQPLLASQWCENQGFVWGDKILALQGHPEMTEALVRDWLRDWAHLLDDSQPSQQSPAQMLDDLPGRVAALNRLAEGVYRHWLNLAFA
ncbi:type 1 glutamine amidotransferase [Pseudomonas sp. UBA2684]|uniref:type 1 glutamine amidotransferase n=1 Tax=Pseudomonas sp. UBA2684 TaxID=1947311 RepID=UPI0025CD2441|nr:type 1 glutamine amidotransferase [Pseudomonas sp. UBA2684]|tara:strand:- start:12594 stop:13301 length:708 start_codon:yes stop_codon:yes gene_type:complete